MRNDSMTRKLVFALSLLAAMPLFAASDVLTVGTLSAPSGSVAAVPVYVRDVAGTPLGMDQAAVNRIQGVGFKIVYSPASAVSLVTFTPAGVLQGLTPLYQTVLTPAASIGVVGSFAQSTNPIPFALNAAAPGSLIGYLNVTIAQSVSAGTTIALAAEPVTATLSNQAGTVIETGNNGKLAVINGAITVTAPANDASTPTNVLATATSPTSVYVSWTGTPAATYEVVRVGAGNVTTTVGSSNAGALSDTNVSANTAYLYKVHAITPAGAPFSTPDLATTVIFTDPSIGAGTTIKAAHFAELRTAVDAVRALAGLGGGSYSTDPTLNAGATLIKAAHLTELRTALDQARASVIPPMPLPAISYATPNIVAGATTISAADVNDLRNGVR
jgi:hypothetical protein